MKPIFNFDRFVSLLVRDLQLNKRTYTTYILVGLCTIAGLLFFYVMTSNEYSNPYLYDDPMLTFENGIFWAGLSIFICFGASMIMRPLSSKDQSIAYLTFPASNLEKYLTRWIICVPGSLIVFLLGFECVDLLRYGFLKILYQHSQCIHLFPTMERIKLANSPYLVGPFFCTIIVQSIYVLGSAIWPKRAALYTTIAIMVIPMALTWLIILTLKLIDDWQVSINIVGALQMFDIKGLPWIVAGIFVLFNYIVGYFRFRESEIIQRW